MSIKVTSSILFWCLRLYLFCTLEVVVNPGDPRKKWLGVNSGLPSSAWEMLNQPSASFPHLASLPASTACVGVLVWVLTVSVCPFVCICVCMFLCIQVCLYVHVSISVCLCVHYVPCLIVPPCSLACSHALVSCILVGVSVSAPPFLYLCVSVCLFVRVTPALLAFYDLNQDTDTSTESTRLESW